MTVGRIAFMARKLSRVQPDVDPSLTLTPQKIAERWPVLRDIATCSMCRPATYIARASDEDFARKALWHLDHHTR